MLKSISRAVPATILAAVLGSAAVTMGQAQTGATTAEAPNADKAVVQGIIAPLASGALLSDAVTTTAQSRKAVTQQPAEGVFPELIIGGEWTSTVRLTNRGNKAIPATSVFFVDNAGNPMQATYQITGGSVVTDYGFSFLLNVGGILETTFFGGQTTQFGFALIDGRAINFTASGLYAEISLKNRNATRPDFESIFPLEQPAALQYMLFDGRNGYTTVLYVINGNAGAAGLSIDIVDASGTIRRTVRVPMKGAETQLLTLHVLAPETIGIQGTLVFRADSPASYFVATALRVNPSNSFTPLRAWVPAQ